jgi:hypothetical protein
MIVLHLDEIEVQLLQGLLADYEILVQSGNDDDLALQRLFPNAYPDDQDAAAEFARYTRTGLVDTKTANAGSVVAALAAGDGTVELSGDAAEQWLPVLTDLRLVLAQRLGIRTDDDPVPDDGAGEIYHWLGALQAHLIDAIDGDL